MKSPCLLEFCMVGAVPHSATQNGTKRESDASKRGKSADSVHRAFRMPMPLMVAIVPENHRANTGS
jgi:hypothetical protein